MTTKTEVRFYHLLRQNVGEALPALCAKALSTGKTIIIKAPDSRTAEMLNDQLWSYDAGSFLPHGTEKDGKAEKQPIWITEDDNNPNAAKILILTYGTNTESLETYDLCCEIFDGRNEDAVTHARQKWKIYKENENLELTYWQQGDTGWEKKA